MYAVDRRGRAVGLLLAAGAFGAVGGPAMVEGAQRLAQGSSNGNSFVLPWFLVALLAAIGLSCVLALRPDPRDLSIRDEVSPALGFADSTKGLASAVGGLCGGFVVDATGFAVLGVTAAAMFLPVVLLLLPLRELQPGQWTDITREPASE